MSLPVDEVSVLPTAGTELSIAFSTEELVALSRLTGYRLAMLGPNPLAHVRLAERTAVLDVATRSLRARNVVTDPSQDSSIDGPTTVAEPVLGLLAIIDGAALRADVTVTPSPTSASGAPTWRRRYHAVPYAAMAHDHHDGVHRFTPFATEDLLARLAREAHLAQRPTIDTDPFTVPYATLASARSSAAGTLPADEEAARDPVDILANAGVEPGTAALFAAALAAPGRTVAVRVTHRSGARALTGGELVWLDAGDCGLWLEPSIDQSFGREAGEHLDLAALDDTPVEVVPTTAEHIAERLFSFLPAPR